MATDINVMYLLIVAGALKGIKESRNFAILIGVILAKEYKTILFLISLLILQASCFAPFLLGVISSLYLTSTSFKADQSEVTFCKTTMLDGTVNNTGC